MTYLDIRTWTIIGFMLAAVVVVLGFIAAGAYRPAPVTASADPTQKFFALCYMGQKRVMRGIVYGPIKIISPGVFQFYDSTTGGLMVFSGKCHFKQLIDQIEIKPSKKETRT